VPRIAYGRAGPLDYAGALAGLALIGLAFRLGLRGRGRLAHVLALAVVALLLQFYALPLLSAGLAVNAPRAGIPPARTLGLSGAQDVPFPATDGVRLSGWLVPGRNGAGVVLAHGSHDSRLDVRRHLRMLARAGYAVLAFDARGHGASAGRPNALGWAGDADVAGAVAFLHRRVTGPVAVLGLSMGAEEALRAAAGGAPITAVIADGAGASTLGDSRLTSSAVVPTVVAWLTMRATELLSGRAEPAPLKGIVGRIRVPVLLVASGAHGELALARAYAERIGRSATVWHVPDAAHTEALARHPAAYAARVMRLLAGATAQRTSRRSNSPAPAAASATPSSVRPANAGGSMASWMAVRGR
jgi:pimeloyl-ACP methyl ester carboxylesterase